MTDRFGQFAAGISSPATRSTPIVPHDTQPLDPIPKAIHVGTAGTIVGRLVDDTADRTFKVGAGPLPYRFKLIKAAGTTAADLVGVD